MKGYVVQSKPILNVFLQCKELWDFRSVFHVFLMKDLVVRYRETIAGVLWMVIQPLLYISVLYFVFHTRFANDISMPYGQYMCLGIVVWLFFNNSIMGSSESIYQNKYLISKIYFPHVLLPITNVAVKGIDAVVMSVLYIVLSFVFSWQISFLHVFFLLLSLTVVWLMSSAMGIILASLVSVFRDIFYILPFIMQLLFFATPIFYTLSPFGVLTFLSYNPLAIILEMVRTTHISFEFVIVAIGSILLWFVALIVHRVCEPVYMNRMNV